MTCPDLIGGTNFYPPSYDPVTRLFFVNARETCGTYFGWKSNFKVGEWFLGGATERAKGPQGHFGALRAIDPTTGERRWEFRYPAPGTAGVESEIVSPMQYGRASTSWTRPVLRLLLMMQMRSLRRQRAGSSYRYI